MAALNPEPVVPDCVCYCECPHLGLFAIAESGERRCLRCVLGYHQRAADGYVPLLVLPNCSVCANPADWQYATSVLAGGEPDYRCGDHPQIGAAGGERVRLLHDGGADGGSLATPRQSTQPVCIPCNRAGETPQIVDALPGIVYHPGYAIPGFIVIQGTRLNAELLADSVRNGAPPEDLQKDMLVPEGGLSVALWWAALYGPKRFRAWRPWARDAQSHLWGSCINVGWPSTGDPGG